MDHYEFYKDLYFRENERRTDLENSLNIPFAIITALVAGIYILATTFPYSSAEAWSKYLFIILMIGTSLTLAAAVYFVVLVYGDASGFFHIFNPGNTFSYRGIPYTQSLFNWHANMVIFYTSTPPPVNSSGVAPTPLQQADDDLREHLLNQFVSATNHNTFVNDQKLTDIYRTKKFLIIALIFNFIALFPYMYGFVTKEDEVHKVELVNKGKKTESSKADSIKNAKNMKKTHSDTTKGKAVSGQYRQVDARHAHVKVDSLTGKPCPPAARVIKEGKYPDKPLNYKK